MWRFDSGNCSSETNWQVINRYEKRGKKGRDHDEKNTRKVP